jgi:hypothetical protein
MNRRCRDLETLTCVEKFKMCETVVGRTGCSRLLAGCIWVASQVFDFVLRGTERPVFFVGVVFGRCDSVSRASCCVGLGLLRVMAKKCKNKITFSKGYGKSYSLTFLTILKYSTARYIYS